MLVTGRAAAFEKAVNAYFNDLYRFAYWLCRNRWQAEDLVQEALLRAWRGWPGLRDERAVKTWFFTIVHRELRRAGQRAARTDSSADSDELAFDPDPASCVDVERALRELPAPYRAIVFLREMEGLSTKEVAKVMGISEDNVKARLHRARLQLQAALGSGAT